MAFFVRVVAFAAVFAWFVHANFAPNTPTISSPPGDEQSHFTVPLAALAGLLCSLATTWAHVRRGRATATHDPKQPLWQPLRTALMSMVTATIIGGIAGRWAPPMVVAWIGVVVGVIMGSRLPPAARPATRTIATHMAIHGAVGATLGALIAVITISGITMEVTAEQWWRGLAGAVVTAIAIGIMTGARSLTEAKHGLLITPPDSADHLPLLIPGLVLLVAAMSASRFDSGVVSPQQVWVTKIGVATVLSALFSAMGARQGAAHGIRLRSIETS